MSTHGTSAVILAGTHEWNGSAFQALGARPLVPVALSPLVSYSLRWLKQGGVDQVTICAQSASRVIGSALGDGADLGVRIEYHSDEMPLGAAGCVRDATLASNAETLVIADGSAIPTVDLSVLLDAHVSTGAAVTAVVHRDPARPQMLAPGGFYVFSRRALDYIAPSGFQDIKENLIPRLHRAGERVLTYESGGVCPRVLNASTYLAVNQWMLERLAAEEGDQGEPLVHPTAYVERGARLVGPVQLGRRVRVQAGATVVGPTTIGADSVVGPALVARSVVWSRCVVAGGAVVHGSVVADDAVIPSRARLFNVVHRAAAGGSVTPAAGRPAAAPRSAVAAPTSLGSRPALIG